MPAVRAADAVAAADAGNDGTRRSGARRDWWRSQWVVARPGNRRDVRPEVAAELAARARLVRRADVARVALARGPLVAAPGGGRGTDRPRRPVVIRRGVVIQPGERHRAAGPGRRGRLAALALAAVR